MTQFKPVTHIIFDVDGLLVDSERYYSEALTEVCSRYGVKFTNAVKAAMMGTKPLEGTSICIDMLGLKGKVTPQDLVTQYEAVMKESCHKIRLMPGAERLIKHLNEHNVPIAIASGSSFEGFERKTKHLGEILRKHFCHHVFAGSDTEVERGKPHPDVFLVAARRFNPPPKEPSNVLVFEDAENGVKAALAAKAQVVFVPDPRFCVEPSKIKVKPTLTLSSLEQFKPELLGLPPF